MPKILNLTQHDATPQQIVDGVIDLDDAGKAVVRKLLTFDELPSKAEIDGRAEKLAEYVERLKAERFDAIMLAGAPYLLYRLHSELERLGFKVVYSFSKREKIEKRDATGNIVYSDGKFVHAGFVSVSAHSKHVDE
jgi:hypothetical protein